VLTVVGTVIAAFLSASFFPDLLVNPAVNVEVRDSEMTTPQMIITNDGSEPANNVHLFIEGIDKKIYEVKNDFSTTSVFLVQPKPESGQEKQLEIDKPQCFMNKSECFPKEPIKLLEIRIPKLVQGLGSEVGIVPTLESRYSLPSGAFNYRVVVSYDEGSGVVSDNPNYVRMISRMFSYGLFYTQGGLALLIFLISVIVLIPIISFVQYRNHKIKKRTIIDKLLKVILENRQIIVKEGYTTNKLFNKWTGPELGGIITNPKDYTIIDDLHAKIDNRNREIGSLPDYDKKERNTECFNLMEKALNIEWSNYL
jgi:hypothetical protein